MTTGYAAVGHGLTPEGREDPGAVGNGWTEQTAGDHVTAAYVDRMRELDFGMHSEAYKRDPNFVGSWKAANSAGVDFVIAFHHDIAVAPDGTFVYHYPGSSDGRRLARALVNAVAAAGLPTRDAWLGPGKGFADSPVAPRALSLLANTRAPAVLVEVGPIGGHLHDTPEELRGYGRIMADATARFFGVTPTTAAPKVHRDVAVAARREPDWTLARLLGQAHGFAAVQRAGDRWRQTWPDGTTGLVDTIDYLLPVGWEADKLLDLVGDGRPVAGPTYAATAARVIEMIRDTEVPRQRPWAA